MALPTLVQSGYILPGAYLGRLLQARPSGVVGLRRQLNVIGQGSRYKYQKAQRMIRSYVQNASLTFSGVTFQAPLVHAASGDKSIAILHTGDGTPVSGDKWSFVNFDSGLGGWTAVQINSDTFNPDTTYALDYQSVDRSVKDPLPFDELRQILAVGNSQGQKLYKEGIHFFIDTAITQPVADAGNSNKSPSVSAVTPDVGNTGTGTVSFNAGNAPTYHYNRAYLLEVTAASGVSPNRSATFRVTAVALGGGNHTVPDQTVADQGDFNVIALETGGANLDRDLGNGLKLDFAYGLTHFVVGDKFTFDQLGGARFELADTLENTNQFPEVTAPTAGPITTQPQWSANTGSGTVAVGSDASYTGPNNKRYELEVTAVGGASPNRTATVRWRAIGELPATTGTLSLTETPPAIANVVVELGIKLTFAFGLTNFAVGDMFAFEAHAPRTFYSGKDDRDITVTVTAATGGATPTVSYAWVSDTVEGSSGSSGGGVQQDVPTLLRSGLYLTVRNAKKTDTLAYFVAGNKFTFTASDADTVDWSLQESVSEVITASFIRSDPTGAATGTAGVFYVALENAPDTILSVRNNTSLVPIPYSTVTDANGNLLPYILFATNPGVTLQVNYLFKSLEPNPGDVYYVSATQLRPVTDYNIPIRALSPDDADLFFGPMEPGNHILIAALLAFENEAPVVWATQAYDANGDGILDSVDYRAAIDGCEVKSDITDDILLSAFGTIGYFKNHIEKINDPFRRKSRAGWFGVPINTPLGDVDTVGSRVYTATQLLRFSASSPARGRTILATNTWGKVTILLPDNSTLQVTLDGSFIAAALAGKTDGFNDPAKDLINNDIAGFDDIDPVSEAEQIIAGAAGMTTLKIVGDPPAAVFRVVDSLTTDPDLVFRDINGMTQDMAFERKTNSDVEAVIGLTPATGAQGVDTVAGVIGASCRQQVANGTIAPYQDDNGNPVKFDKQKHLIVEQDENDKDLYRYLVTFWRKNSIKRVLGLYAPNVSNVQTLVANT